MRIAIIGAGFAGLAAAMSVFELSSHHQIDIFDNVSGASASRTAAGLMHPFTGAASKYNWLGSEGYQATKRLLEIAGSHIGETVYEERGLLRVALTDKQKGDFRECSSKNKKVHWISQEECNAEIAAIPGPGIMIEQALHVYTNRYIEGLLTACQIRGAGYFPKEISELNELDDYDFIIVAAGENTATLLKTANLTPPSLMGIKGQIVTLPWPDGLKPLPFPISSQAYLVMDPSGKQCYAGSTYERQWSDNHTDIEKAEALILPKVAKLFPPLSGVRASDCKAAVRIMSADKRPICRRVSEKVAIMTGFGSKGLLYHALYAKQLAEELFYSP